MNSGNGSGQDHCGIFFQFVFFSSSRLASRSPRPAGAASAAWSPIPAALSFKEPRYVLLNPATGVTQHTVTSSAGLYTFISLNPGVYKVTASQTGFKSVAQEKITVNVDQVTEVNITLQVGAATETVTVTRRRLELVEPSNSTVGSLIGGDDRPRASGVAQRLRPHPVECGRECGQRFAQLQRLHAVRSEHFRWPPGSRRRRRHHQRLAGRIRLLHDRRRADWHCRKQLRRHYSGDEHPRGWRGGSSRRDAEYSGVLPERRRRRHQPGQQVGHEQVPWRRFRSIPARRPGCQRLFQQAKPASRTGRPILHLHSTVIRRAARSVDPIKKDKLFFFADYEDTQQVQFEGLKTYAVPTSAERTGDFSQMGFTIYDPTLPDIQVTCTSGQAFATSAAVPGNKIPNP